MVRRFSFLATGLVLVLASIGLLAAGCGGGGGAAGNGSSEPGTGSLSLRLSRGAVQDAAEVRGDEVHLAVSSPVVLRTLRVELFRLPVAQPPTPAISQDFDITPETSSVSIQDIPVGTYLLVLTSFDALGQAIGEFRLEVTIEPGSIASIQASLTPVSSPSPSPTLSPGAIRQVTTALLPAKLPRIAMTSTGEFVVGWGSSTRAGDSVFATSYDASGTALPTFTDRTLAALPAGATLQEHSLALSDDGKLLAAVGSQQIPNVGARLTEVAGATGVLEYEVFDRTTGTSFLGGLQPFASDTDIDWLEVHAMLPPVTTSLVGAILHLERSVTKDFDSAAATTFTIPPLPFTTPDLVVFGFNQGFTMSGSVMAEDEVGNFVFAMANQSGSVYELKGQLFANGISPSSAFDVDLSIPGLLAPDVDVAVRNGRFVVAWTKVVGGALHVFYHLYRFDPGSTGTAPVLLHGGQVSTADASNLDPDTGIDGQGNVVVTWSHFPGAGAESRLMARAVRVDGAAGAVFEISAGLANTRNFPGRVAMDAAGRFQATWADPSDGRLYLRGFPAGFGQP